MNIENIKNQLQLLKHRLDKVEVTLKFHEHILDNLSTNVSSLFSILQSVNDTSVEGIMRKQFKNKELPKIMFK